MKLDLTYFHSERDVVRCKVNVKKDRFEGTPKS